MANLGIVSLKPHLLQISCKDKPEFMSSNHLVFLICLPVKVKKLVIQKYLSIGGNFEIINMLIHVHS